MYRGARGSGQRELRQFAYEIRLFIIDREQNHSMVSCFRQALNKETRSHESTYMQFQRVPKKEEDNYFGTFLDSTITTLILLMQW